MVSTDNRGGNNPPLNPAAVPAPVMFAAPATVDALTVTFSISIGKSKICQWKRGQGKYTENGNGDNFSSYL